MEKAIRCTVCPWRGTWSDAASVRPPRPSQIPPPMQEVQQAYEERQQAAAQLGTPQPPPCPDCGHHTVLVRMSHKSPVM